MQAESVAAWWGRTGLPLPPDARVEISGADPVLAARHRIGEAAACASALVGCWAARFHERRGGAPQAVRVEVSQAAASLLSFLLQRCDGAGLRWERDPITGFFATADGRWVHLHGGFPHLARGTLALLGAEPNADAIAAAVSTWNAHELEHALAEERLCAALVRTPEEWLAHPQGLALAVEPTVRLTKLDEAPPRRRRLAGRPLEGLRVADFTRVLAGPTCGRTLAAHGADVVRIASPKLPSLEPFVIDTGRGKRSAFVDLDEPGEHARLLDFLREADVVAQGYRAGSLERRGLGARELAERHPGIIYVSINCYGHVGPWAQRGGWEQLAQSASGIAHVEAAGGVPALLPAAATDYTTGTLAAAGALAALDRQATEGGSWLVEASLCQTAAWIRAAGADRDPSAATGFGPPALTTVATAWGELAHLQPVEGLTDTPARWEQPPVPLGSNALRWLQRARVQGAPT